MDKQIFIGRKDELQLLNSSFKSNKSEIVVIYGRRRIGKSRLIEEFCQGKKVLYFEGLENQHTQSQLQNIKVELIKQTDDPLLKGYDVKSWQDFFSYLYERQLSAEDKTIIVLDEFQWLAAKQSKLVSVIKFYWDKYLKQKNVMLILCGSVASYMIDSVLKSSALYGRISHEICLKHLCPSEVYKMFKNKRSKEEILKYLLVLGGVPKYIEDINLNKSFSVNMNLLFFGEEAIFYNEYEKIFYSQFREPQIYAKICRALYGKAFSISEINNKIKIKSGGGGKRYIDNLEKAEFIKSYYPYNNENRIQYRKYKLIDEYLNFYFKFIGPNKHIIPTSTSKNLFELLTNKKFDIYLGFAFERFCLKNSFYLAKFMGFADKVLSVSPYFGKNDKNFQIDLVYTRADNTITVCEVKYQNNEIAPKIIPEMERKCKLLKTPKGFTLERALICINGPSKSLKETEYFHHIITLKDILKTTD